MPTICQVPSKQFMLVISNPGPQKISVPSTFKVKPLGFRSAKDTQPGSNRARIQTSSVQA